MKKAVKTIQLENVKLKSAIVATLRANKKKTGIPISTFIEQAITEKQQRDKQK